MMVIVSAKSKQTNELSIALVWNWLNEYNLLSFIKYVRKIFRKVIPLLLFLPIFPISSHLSTQLQQLHIFTNNTNDLFSKAGVLTDKFGCSSKGLITFIKKPAKLHKSKLDVHWVYTKYLQNSALNHLKIN